MIFFKIDVQFCIDISFMNRMDEEYYKGVLLFVVLNIGMVIYFFFDYMYFVCLGVIQCFFFLLMKGFFKCCLSVNSVKSIFENLEVLKNNVLLEFV